MRRRVIEYAFGEVAVWFLAALRLSCTSRQRSCAWPQVWYNERSMTICGTEAVRENSVMGPGKVVT